MSLADLRREYTRHGLDEATVDPDPLRQFRLWFDRECEQHPLKLPAGQPLDWHVHEVRGVPPP